jgi:NAD(P)-dependent dehydrogenase (short-subunit alcohol dehydrogenase family)
MKKIIITGSEGLIGKNLSNYLKKKFEIVKIDFKLGHDLNDEEQVKKIFKLNKNSDYLINLHGLNDHVKKKNNKKENSKEIFLKYCLDNVYSVYLTNKFFINYCKDGKGIVNFASLYGINSPKHFLYKQPKDIFYITSKYSVIGLTKYLATMHGKKIKINCIVNGGVLNHQPANFIKGIKKYIPKGRLMKIKDFYGIIELLCSNKSDYFNGSPIIIDGGYSSW